MDVRLYHKAKAITEPFAYAEYRKAKIREKIEADRKSRVQVNRNASHAKGRLENWHLARCKRTLASILVSKRGTM